jgi:hypothetical protein
MRFVLTTASLMIVSLLIFQGYSNGAGKENYDFAGTGQIDSLQKASEVNQLIQETSYSQRPALEKQIQN